MPGALGGHPFFEDTLGHNEGAGSDERPGSFCHGALFNRFTSVPFAESLDTN